MSGVLVLPRGKLNKRNRALRSWAMANGWRIEFVGGETDEYRGSELTEPIYIDECPEDIQASFSGQKPQEDE